MTRCSSSGLEKLPRSRRVPTRTQQRTDATEKHVNTAEGVTLTDGIESCKTWTPNESKNESFGESHYACTVAQLGQ